MVCLTCDAWCVIYCVVSCVVVFGLLQVWLLFVVVCCLLFIAC